MASEQNSPIRLYGAAPYNVVVVHGGPGACGEMAVVAEELSKSGGVVEPLQTETSLEGQITELTNAIEQHAEITVTLIGYSYGAWLGCIVAARFPRLIKKLILVSAGPFVQRYAQAVHTTRMKRLAVNEQKEFDALSRQLFDTGSDTHHAAVARLGALAEKADLLDPLPTQESAEINGEIFARVWPQASLLRKTGALLELTKEIRCPVTALHGDYDPHPAEGVREPLGKTLEDFRFILLKNCGHTPWKERRARRQFYQIVFNELASACHTA